MKINIDFIFRRKSNVRFDVNSEMNSHEILNMLYIRKIVQILGFFSMSQINSYFHVNIVIYLQNK